MKKIAVLLVFILTVGISHGMRLSAAEPETAMRVEAEWCTDTNLLDENAAENLNGIPIYRGSTFSGGVAVGANFTTDIPEGGYYLNYPVYVPSGGFYYMDFMTSVLGFDYTSEFTVQINDSRPLQINDASASRVADGYDSVWAEYRLRVYLEPGSNTIRFLIQEHPAQNPGAVVFYCDYFELTYDTVQTNRAEGEYFINPSAREEHIHVSSDDTEGSQISGKSFLNFGGAYDGTAETLTAQIYLYVPEDGEYKLKTGCTILGVDYTGRWSITGEGGDTLMIGSDTTSLLGTVTGYGDVIRIYETRDTIWLHEGYNLMTIEAWPRGEDFTTYVDYIESEKAESAVARQISVEAESCEEPGYWQMISGTEETSFFSQAAGLRLDQTDATWGYQIIGDEFLISYDFEVPEDDVYELYLSISAADNTNVNFSPVEMRIDQGKWIEFDQDNFQLDSQIGTLTPVYHPARYRYVPELSLTAGTHTIDFRVREARPNQSDRLRYCCTFDRFELIPDGLRFGSMEAQLSAASLTVGQQAQLTAGMFDESGGSMEAEAFSIDYQSDNPGVAAVDSNGVVTGTGIGRANLTVICTHLEEGITLSQDVPVMVTSDYLGIIIHEVVSEDGNLKVTLSNPVNTGNAMQIIVTESGEQDGYDTPLTALHVVDVHSASGGTATADELHGIMPVTFQVPLENPNSRIAVYLWDSTESMTALWTQTEPETGF